MTSDRICHAFQAIVIDARPGLHHTVSIGVAVIGDLSFCKNGKTVIQEA